MTLIQEERSVRAVVVSLFTIISKQNAYFVYGLELYSWFCSRANKIAILFVMSQKELALRLCLPRPKPPRLEPCPD